MTEILIICAFRTGWTQVVDYYAPENILKFAEHLYQEKEYLSAAAEYQRYLFMFSEVLSSEEKHKIIYKIGLCYRLTGNFSKAIEWFDRIIKPEAKSELVSCGYYQIAYTYFLMNQYNNSILKAKEALASDRITTSNQNKFFYLIGLNYLKKKKWNNAYSIFDSLSKKDENLKASFLKLKEYAEEGKKLPYKSPLLAALLSGIIPGVGKIYSLRFKDGLYSFILIVSTFWVAYDSFKKEESTKGYLFSCFSISFYAGNIYGSYLAAKIYNRNIENELFAKIQLESNLFE